LLPLALALLVYPMHAWRDAPVFPTPLQALRDLPGRAPLPPQALILDAGCGAGDGLKALRLAYPQARWVGIEFSRPLRWLAKLRCPWASVRHGDIWLEDWGSYDMVYLFQGAGRNEAGHLAGQSGVCGGGAATCGRGLRQ
jgi:SAM-dependent methyltransferase